MNYMEDAMSVCFGANAYAEYNGRNARLTTIVDRLVEQGFKVYDVSGYTDEDRNPLPGDSGLWQTDRKIAVRAEPPQNPVTFTPDETDLFENFTRENNYLWVYFEQIARCYPPNEVFPHPDEDEIELTDPKVLLEPTKD